MNEQKARAMGTQFAKWGLAVMAEYGVTFKSKCRCDDCESCSIRYVLAKSRDYVGEMIHAAGGNLEVVQPVVIGLISGAIKSHRARKVETA